MAQPPATEKRDYRLVLWAAREIAPRAYVYTADAGQYATPLFWFEPKPYQRIPRAEPGSVVTAQGSVAAGEAPSFVSIDGVVVQPVGKLHQGEGAPLFAERYSGAVHPTFESRQSNWQKAAPLPQTASEWDTQVARLYRRSRRAIVGGSAFVALALAVIVVAIVRNHGDVGVRFYYYGGGGSSGVGAIASFRRARRARSVAERAHAQRQRPAIPMYMHFWWSVGDGWGRVPIAALSDTPDGAPLAHVPLATVPSGYDPPAGTQVQVHGDLKTGAPPVIRDGEIDLWPAEAAAAALHGHRRRRAKS